MTPSATVPHPAAATGTVRLSSFASASAGFLPLALGAHRAEFPGVAVVLQDLESFEGVAALQRGDVDLAVVFESPGRGPGVDYHGRRICPDDTLRSVALFDDPYLLLVPTDHRLAAGRPADLADLAGETFLGSPTCPGLDQLADGVRRAGGELAFAAYEGVDFAGLQGAVAASGSLALVPALAVSAAAEGVRCVPLVGARPLRTICVAQPDGELALPARSVLAALLCAAAVRGRRSAASPRS